LGSFDGNLINNSLALPAWGFSQGIAAAYATDQAGGNSGGLITGITGANSLFAGLISSATLAPSTTYTFTGYVLGTSGATVFPALGLVSNSSTHVEFATVVNTNTGAVVAGTWAGGSATISATAAGSWWLVKMIFTTPAGSNSAYVYLTPPVANSSGVRSTQASVLTATYCFPAIHPGSN